MYYNGEIINVVLLEDSCGVPGSVHHNRDDSYTIFIDAKLSYEKQHEVFLHELRHVANHDFEKTDIQMIEYYNHLLDDILKTKKH